MSGPPRRSSSVRRCRAQGGQRPRSAGAGRKSAEGRLAVRVGLNTGEPLQSEGGGYFGAAVVAARICFAADGGEILVSDLVRSLVESRGTHGFVGRGPVPLTGSASRCRSSRSGGSRTGGAPHFRRLSWPPARARRPSSGGDGSSHRSSPPGTTSAPEGARWCSSVGTALEPVPAGRIETVAEERLLTTPDPVSRRVVAVRPRCVDPRGVAARHGVPDFRTAANRCSAGTGPGGVCRCSAPLYRRLAAQPRTGESYWPAKTRLAVTGPPWIEAELGSNVSEMIGM
jgi:hypothetical protein